MSMTNEWVVAVEYLHDRAGTRVGRGDVAAAAFLAGMITARYRAAAVYADERRRVHGQIVVPDDLRGKRPPEWAAWSAPGIRDHDVAAYCVALVVPDADAVIGVDTGVGMTKHSGTGVCAVVDREAVFAATLRPVRRADPAAMCIDLYRQVVEVIDHIRDTIDGGTR